MVSKAAAFLLSLTPTAAAWPWGKSGAWCPEQGASGHGGTSFINYTSVPGFFQQDDPATDPSTFDYTETNFGLIDQSYPSDSEATLDGKKTLWQRFEHYVNRLNWDADENTQYKVLFMARHGEGFHNAAEDYFGTPAWNCYWGLLDGNETVTWRDAHLTEAGIAQTKKAADFWARQLAVERQPAPQAFHTSPLTRCTTTANLTFGGLADGNPRLLRRPFAPTVRERLREGISARTCDARPRRSYIAALLPRVRFEEGFAERDGLWRGGLHAGGAEGETPEAQLRRARGAVDDVFAGSGDSTWVSVTSHSGQIRAMLQVLNHRPFRLATGQAIAVLVRAERGGGGQTPTPPPTTTSATSFASWTAEPTCGAPPITSISGTGCVCSSSTLAITSATATLP